MRISRVTRNAAVSVALAGGAIAVPVALLPAQHAAARHVSAAHAAAATAPAGTRASHTARATPHAGTSLPALGLRKPPVPGLSINVSDGRDFAKAGDQLSYLLSIKDSGGSRAPHLKITQTLPAGLQFLSASRHGVVTAGRVSWSAGISPGATQTFRVTARVARIPAGLRGLAVVACAAEPRSVRPLICAAHLDELPAGLAAAARARHTPASGHTLTYIVSGIVILVLVAGGAIAGRRTWQRRRVQRSA